MNSNQNLHEELSSSQQVLLTLKAARTKLEAVEYSQTEPIAIVGMGCRFPGGANNPEAFWQILRDGIDTVREIPRTRWNIDDYYDLDSNSPGKISTRFGSFIEGIDQFEPQFFGISPREANSLDPQQRLLLEVSWEALENAGIAPSKLAGSQTGVFIGIGQNDYAQLGLNSSRTKLIEAYDGTGNGFCFASGRISYTLGLQGPNLATDTACSSSLISIHTACQSLRLRECNLAIAGGVQLILTPEVTVFLSKARALSPDGRCKTFDASADGYGRGEGCGIIVLKRLSDAKADGDNILALIRGSAVNHDGASSGLTVPNKQAQQKLIRQALYNARVEPREIDYIEAHGTGTALGDPIELEAVGAVLGEGRSENNPLLIGSVKTNIGHLEAAAGIAGVIKLVLSLQHKAIPPHLHFKKPSPYVNWNELPVKVPQSLTPWDSETRLAGISSFGMSGTNAHIILEEAPVVESVTPELDRPLHLLTLSAKSDITLLELANRYCQYLQTKSSLSLGDICYSANTGRDRFEHRLSVIASTTASLQEKLAALVAKQEVEGLLMTKLANKEQKKIAFLFTGQGSQYVGMGQQLYQTQPTFRREFDRCDEILHPYLEKPLLEIIDSDIINQTAYTQPAIFALEYALASLWMSWGIKPDAVMGHSLGEYVAATVAGVFSLEDALKLIVDRARLIQSLPQNGSMVAVFAELKQVETAIEPYVKDIALAAINGTKNIVISGEKTAVQKAIVSLEARGVKTKTLQVSHAFHSPLMQPILAEFEAIASKVTYNEPQISLISNLTGKQANDEIATVEYWVNHLIKPVKFVESINTLDCEGNTIFLEIGVQPILLGMGSRCLPDKDVLWLPSIRPQREDWQQMLESLGQLYLEGIEIDWAEFDKDYIRNKVTLPTYAFQRQQYWIETPETPNIQKTISENNSTSIFKLLNQGNTQQLSQKLEETGQFLPEQVKLLPKLLEVLAKQHQKELIENTIDELLYQVQWQPLETKNNPAIEYSQTSQPNHWLIFADTTGVGKAIAEGLRQSGDRCTLVYSADNYQKTEKDIYYLNPATVSEFETLWGDEIDSEGDLTGIIHLWSLEAPPTEQLTISALEKAQRLGCGSLLHLIQTLSKREFSNHPKLWLVTRGSQPVNSQKISIAQTPIWGMGRVVALEYPQLWGGLIDLDPASPEDEIEMLLGQIQSQQKEDHLAFRDRQIYVARLVKQILAESKPFKLRSDATYLITGGNGALGLQVARWMVQQGARHLVLTSRRGESPENKEAIASLKDTEAKVLVQKVNVCSSEDTIALFDLINKSMPPIKGIIHAAGISGFQPLKEIQLSQLETMLSPKVIGSWILHQFSQTMELDFFIGFSSIASVWGSTGQAHYAAANHFIDSLAHYRQGIGLSGQSINWGPWDGGGMVDRQAKKMLSRIGVKLLQSDRAIMVLDKLLAENCTQTTVANINWSLFKQIYTARGKGLLLEAIENKPSPTPKSESQSSSDILQKLEGVSQKEGFDLLKNHIQKIVAQILRLEDSQMLSQNQNFVEMGMDSLMALEFKNKLETNFNCSLSANLAFEFRNLESVSRYIAEEILPWKHLDRNYLEIDNSLEKKASLTKEISKINIEVNQKITTEKAQEILSNLEIITDEEVDIVLNNLLSNDRN